MSDAAEIINMVQDADGRFTPQSVERMERDTRGLVPKLLRVAGKIPFADDLAAAYFAARDPNTPLKAKGVGELGICGVAAAIANAAYNATGVRVRDYPITLERMIDRLPEV